MNAEDSYTRARLLATSAPHSGDWLLAIPIYSCGLRLDNEAIRIAVGLRLGYKIGEPHDCVCGELVEKVVVVQEKVTLCRVNTDA